MITLHPIRVPKPWTQPRLEQAFALAPTLPLRQSWQTCESVELQPGWANIAWNGRSIFFLSRFQDLRIISRSTRDDEPLWRLGDVLEVFINIAGRPDYWEIHLSPRGHLMVLHWPGTEEFRVFSAGGARDIGPFAAALPGLRTSLWRERSAWSAMLELPLAPLLEGADSPSPEISFAVCRYDYTDERLGAAVISSTAPFPEAAFHRREFWTRARLERAA